MGEMPANVAAEVFTSAAVALRIVVSRWSGSYHAADKTLGQTEIINMLVNA